jgi:hypothetical protein
MHPSGDDARRGDSERNLMSGSRSFDLRAVEAVLNFGLPAPIDIQVNGSDLEATHRTAVEIARDFRFSKTQLSREGSPAQTDPPRSDGDFGNQILGARRR